MILDFRKVITAYDPTPEVTSLANQCACREWLRGMIFLLREIVVAKANKNSIAVSGKTSRVSIL
jgi:hypothetical protein